MILTYYVPIFKWGDNPQTVNNGSHGTCIYNDLQMLYAYEPEAIGYFEVTGKVPTKEEFECKNF